MPRPSVIERAHALQDERTRVPDSLVDEGVRTFTDAGPAGALLSMVYASYIAMRN